MSSPTRVYLTTTPAGYVGTDEDGATLTPALHSEDAVIAHVRAWLGWREVTVTRPGDGPAFATRRVVGGPREVNATRTAVSPRYTFRERKAARAEYRRRFVYGWVLVTCTACSGSGYYDHDGSPDCGACDGLGKTRERGPKAVQPFAAEVSRG